MGSNGLAPRPYTARHARTLFVRVSPDDWPLVKRGLKRQFRGMPGKQSALWKAEPPVPAVFYCLKRGEYDARLMVLEEMWQEELGAMSDESLRLEGYESFEHFRRDWMRRRRDGKKFRPTQKVFVYRMRPWEPEDEAELGTAMLRRLYGDWL